MRVKAAFHVYCRLNLSQLWLQTCAVEVKLFCGLGADFRPCRYRGELQHTVSSFPRLPSTTPPRVCARSSLERERGIGEGRVERSGGLQPWNVRALLILSVLVGRGATVRAQPATGLEVQGGGRTTLLELGE